MQALHDHRAGQGFCGRCRSLLFCKKLKVFNTARSILIAMLTPKEGKTAVDLARNSIERAVRGARRISLQDLPAVFQEKRGVFVTITRQGQLRGCIGLPYPTAPLGEAIVEAAVSAALEDPGSCLYLRGNLTISNLR